MTRPIPVCPALLPAAALCSALLVATGCVTGSQDAENAQTQVLLDRGDAFRDSGMLDSALAMFGRALEENPELIDAHLGMGSVYTEMENHELASRFYARAVRIDQNNFDAYYGLGFSRQMLGNVEDGIAAYLRALMIRPDDFKANRDLASAHIQLGRPDEALAYAERSVELKPEDQGAWANLGFAYSRLGRYDEAVNAYRQATELGDLAGPVLLGLGDSHIKLENYPRAENTLRRLVELEPSAAAHERLGVALFKQNRYDEALQQYGLSLIRDPEYVAALNGTGACLMTQYIQSGRERHNLRDQALANWRRSLRIQANQPKIQELVAQFNRM